MGIGISVVLGFSGETLGDDNGLECCVWEMSKHSLCEVWENEESCSSLMSKSEASGRLLGFWKTGSGSVLDEERCSVVGGFLNASDELLGFFVGLVEACLGALNAVFDDLVFRGLFWAGAGRLNDFWLFDLVTLPTKALRSAAKMKIASREYTP